MIRIMNNYTHTRVCDKYYMKTTTSVDYIPFYNNNNNNSTVD